MNQKNKINITKLEDLESYCLKLSKELSPKQILLLNGPMASGKTTFVQYLIKSLGGQNVSSPTFAIHNTYTIKNGKADHIDLYRLKNDSDLESTGFWDLFDQEKGLIIVEWASRLEGHWWPPSWSVFSMEFSILNDTRTITSSNK